MTDFTITVSPTANLSGATTSDLTEGTNQYFTNERVDDRVNSLLTAGSNISLVYDDAANTLTISATEDNLSNNTTDDLSEGSSNLYYTNSRFNTQLATKSTSDLTEGSNLYYTDTRFDTRLSAKSTSDLSEGTNLYYTDSRFDTRLSGKSTNDLSEGTNLYYTDARVNTLLASGATVGTLLPTNANTDLGSSSNPFKELYLSGSSLYLNNVKVLESDATDFSLRTTNASNQNIQIAPDGELKLLPGSQKVSVGASGTELEVNGSLDVNGSADISGDLTGIDNLTVSTKINTNRIDNIDSNGLNIVTDNFVFVDLNQTHSSNTNKLIIGNNSQAVGIDATSIGAGVGTAPNITANDIAVGGSLSGSTGDIEIIKTVDGSAINLKIDDTSSTRRTAMVVKQYDYLADNAVGSPLVGAPFTAGGSTATTQYDSYVVVDGGGIKIGDSGEFSSTGATPHSNAGDYHLNGVLVNPTGNTWPTINLVSTGKSAGMNPLYDHYGTSFGGTFEEYPNAAFLFNAANGLASSPTALGNNKRLGQIGFQAHDGVKYGGATSVASAAITVESVEAAASDNARGAKMVFEFTKKNGASTDGDGPSDRKDTLVMDSDTFTVGASSYPVQATINGDLDVTGAVVKLTGLPTSDPSNAGQLWNDSGTLKISAG